MSKYNARKEVIILNQEKMISEHELEHKEIIRRLEAAEQGIRDLQGLLKNKVDSKTLSEAVQARSKEIIEIKEQIEKLAKADLNHSTTLASLEQMMTSMKEVQDEFKTDIKEMTKSHNKFVNEIEKMLAVLSEKVCAVREEVTTEEMKNSNQDNKTWWERMMSKNPTATTVIGYAVAILILGLLFLLISEHENIIKIFQAMYAK